MSLIDSQTCVAWPGLAHASLPAIALAFALVAPDLKKKCVPSATCRRAVNRQPNSRADGP